MNTPENGVSDPINLTREFALARLKALDRHTLPPSAIARISPVTLAYIGDAVFEIYIRTYYLLPPQRLQGYHNVVVSCVRAETQAQYLNALKPHLNELEENIVRQGRNAIRGYPKRLDPKIYQQATSFEALLGYLYLTNPQRLVQLLDLLELD